VIFIKIYDYIRPQFLNLQQQQQQRRRRQRQQQQQQQKKVRSREMTSSTITHVPRFIKLTHIGFFASSSFSYKTRNIGGWSCFRYHVGVGNLLCWVQ